MARKKKKPKDPMERMERMVKTVSNGHGGGVNAPNIAFTINTIAEARKAQTEHAIAVEAGKWYTMMLEGKVKWERLPDHLKLHYFNNKNPLLEE